MTSSTEGAERARGGSLPRMSIVVGWTGGLAFWAVLLGLAYGVPLPLADSILLAVLFVAVPTMSIAQIPLVEGARIERLPVYWGSIGALWLIGSASWLVGSRAGGAASLGLIPLAPAPLVAWSVGLTLAGLGTILVFRQLATSMRVEESTLIRELFPRSTREKRVFVLLSITAGTGEELAYRGYSIPVLAPLVGTLGAIAVTSVVFGVLHGYQGWIGMVRTAVVGGVLAGGVLASGSLVPAIIAHVAIDLLVGIVWGDALLPPAESTGVVGARFTDPQEKR